MNFGGENEEMMGAELELFIDEASKLLGPTNSQTYRQLVRHLMLDHLNPVIDKFPDDFPHLEKVRLSRLKRGTGNKKDVTIALGTIFSEQKLFVGLIDTFPQNARNLLELLIYKGRQLPRVAQEKTGFTLFDGRIRTLPPEQWSLPVLNFFVKPLNFNSWTTFINCLIGVSQLIHELWRAFMPPFQPKLIVGEPEEELVLFGDQDALVWFQNARTYVDDGNMKLVKKGDRYTVQSLKRFAKGIALSEFFSGEEDRVHLRKETVASTFQLNRDMPLDPGPEGVRSYLVMLFQEGSLPHPTYFHNYADMAGYSTYEKDFGKALWQILSMLTTHDWVQADSLLIWVLNQGLRISPFSPGQGWAVNLTKQYMYSDTEVWYEEFAARPGLYTGLFMAGALGLVELAYLPPSRVNHDYMVFYSGVTLSPADGLRWVRLTPLGAYVLGKTQTPPDGYQGSQRAQISLDENELIISLDNDDISLTGFLATFAQLVGNRRYLVSFDSFFRSINTDQLESLISSFKSRISAEPPANWEAFFDEARSRTRPLIERDELVAFQVDGHAVLLRYLARDPQLRKLVIKAENHLILVERSKVSALKRRLKHHGFLL